MHITGIFERIVVQGARCISLGYLLFDFFFVAKGKRNGRSGTFFYAETTLTALVHAVACVRIKPLGAGLSAHRAVNSLAPKTFCHVYLGTEETVGQAHQ